MFWFGTNKSDNYDDLIQDLESSLNEKPIEEEQPIEEGGYQNNQLFDFSIVAERMANGKC